MTLQEFFAQDGVLPDVEYRALTSSSTPAISLNPATWIWHAADGASQPAGTRYFKIVFELAAGSKIRSARAGITVDNAFQLQVNGKDVCSGDDWLKPVTVDVREYLHEGANEIRVRAVNASPGAAGLVFRLVLERADGTTFEVVSDASWESSQDEKTWAPAAQLGAYGSAAPWAAFQKPAPAPVIEFLHRTVPGKEIYFLANQFGPAVDVEVTLRANGSVVQRFDPLDGGVRELPEKTRGADGRLTVPLHFEKDQAFFVVIGEEGQKSAVREQRSEKNIPELKAVQEVAGPWTVTFDAAWVKPLPPGTPAGAKEVSLSFPVLTDWMQRSEDGIRAYGGVATYRTMFPLPPGIDQRTSLQLDLGTVKEMARVELNGRDLGVVWCPPWRVTIPSGLLKPAANVLVITVANLWNNRLAADGRRQTAGTGTADPSRP